MSDESALQIDTHFSLNFFKESRLQGFQYLKSKHPLKPCGDASLIRDLKNFSYIINCDGVSSTRSPDESSNTLVQDLDKFLSSTRSQKPNLDKLLQLLNKTNLKFVKKNLATTLNLFCFSNKFNFYVGLGDSSFYLFDSNNTLVFQNWIHNQSKIIENHFQKNTGEAHILVNCIGIYQPRYESALKLSLPKGTQIIMHSDGIEQYFSKENDILSFCKKLNQTQELDPHCFDHNDDDLSLIYAEVI